ncbi:MAG TPA: EamA family transporter RarD, partial [Anaerolineae bacterium]|nr:EamA family transporter RarD [Anaerolineae bacterium]
MNKGLLAGFSAFLLWGLSPIFWKLLKGAPTQEVLAHRIVWSVFILVILLTVQGKWAWVKPTLRDKRLLLTTTAAALLLLTNWGFFIWSVGAGYLVEVSLGYFINPLVNVLFGVLLFGERLRRLQKVAIALASSGVLYLTLALGRPPWIALVLAFSFGIYGVLKKRTVLKSAESLTLELTIMFPIAFGYLIFLQATGNAAFGGSNMPLNIAFAFTGFATAVPLVLFAYGAQNITLTTLGILQYIAPSLQFALGVLIYGELFDSQRLIGFLFIWFALILYSAESYYYFKQKSAV